jgi:hypothetical protein
VSPHVPVRRFGIDPDRLYRDRAGRPIPILPECEPVAELLGGT